MDSHENDCKVIEFFQLFAQIINHNVKLCIELPTTMDSWQ